MKTVLTLLFAALALAGCATAKPVQSPASSAGAQPAAYAYVVVPTAPPLSGSPQIFEVALSSRTYSAPGPVSVRVRTSSGVATVTATLMGREVGLPRTADGLFEARQQLADVPFFLKGRDYTVDFVATAQDGRTATAQASVHLNR